MSKTSDLQVLVPPLVVSVQDHSWEKVPRLLTEEYKSLPLSCHFLDRLHRKYFREWGNYSRSKSTGLREGLVEDFGSITPNLKVVHLKPPGICKSGKVLQLSGGLIIYLSYVNV